MGFILAIVALILFVLGGLEVDLASLAPAQLVAFGLASLTAALLVGIDSGFIRNRV